MNSTERVLTALERKVPDRVPVCEMFISGTVIRKICPDCSYHDFVEKYDLDVVIVPSRQDYKKIGENLYTDSFHVVYRDTGAGEWNLTETRCPITSREDLEKYVPPDPEADYRIAELREVIKRFKGIKAIIFLIRDAFSRPRRLMGMQEMLIKYITEPQLVKDVIRISVDYNMRVMEIAVEEGADIIFSTDDYASNYSPLISPAQFKEFIFPELKKIVKRVHELGVKYIKHCDGNIKPIIDMIIDTGIDGLHPIDPGAGMDIAEVKKKYGDRVCLIGNVDCKFTLGVKSVTEVEDEVKQIITGAGQGGGLMISSSNSIHSGVKPENFLAMIEAAKKFGVYN
ncbi:MAG TPA: hypothetical protein ENI15_19385 [Spirochaetes bacterium]|nr:hypothetical protein [Spirochaetota bacterium]